MLRIVLFGLIGFVIGVALSKLFTFVKRRRKYTNWTGPM